MSVQDQINRITSEVGTQNELINQVKDTLQEKLPNEEFEESQINEDNKIETNTRKLENLLGLAKSVPIVVQSDWNQKDETQLDYIKNKPEIIPEILEDSEALVTSDAIYDFLKALEERSIPNAASVKDMILSIERETQGQITELFSVELPVGIVGKDGLSAYEVWLNEGNNGTEEDFLASLKGKDGATGPQGKDGEQGPQGIQGPKGDTGEPGPQGVQGIQGPKGEDGYTPKKGDDYFGAS